MLPFHQAVEDDFTFVNTLIIQQLHSDVGLVENIGHYIVDAGGKRLRPLLVLLCARALGYSGKNVTDLAVIIEFIHTATLLHDDVVDVSALRRGRPTANAEWGNAPSVLVGDFLYSRAFQMLVRVGVMDIMAIISDSTNTISEGEVQQLVNAKDPSVSEANYFDVIHKKTGALFEAACETAAVLSGASEQQRNALRQYGYHLGMAFQLVDDALDYEGDVESLGKNVGDDLAEGKPTLPLIYAMANANKTDSELIANAIKAGAVDQLNEVVAIVRATGALDYTNRQAAEQVESAKQQLNCLTDSRLKTAMESLADFAIGRKH
jgi:octaprenyl-diphosphate synthase